MQLYAGHVLLFYEERCVMLNPSTPPTQRPCPAPQESPVKKKTGLHSYHADRSWLPQAREACGEKQMPLVDMNEQFIRVLTKQMHSIPTVEDDSLHVLAVGRDRAVERDQTAAVVP